MTTTLTVADFILQRVAEDEAAALRARSHTVWHTLGNRGWDDFKVHVARHDPARVLAECAAKREIVRYHGMLLEQGEQHEVFGYHATGMGIAIRYLAAVYSDHSDYNPDWA